MDVITHKGRRYKMATLESSVMGNCIISLTLDARYKDDNSKYHASVRFTVNGDRYYLHLGYKYTADEFEAIGKYSPEQQMEIDILAIREVSKPLSDAVASLEKSLAIIPSLAEKLTQATKIELSETTINEIIAIGESTGKSAAQIFRKEVEPVIKKAQRRTDYISIPAPAYYCLILLLLALFGFAVAICMANYTLWGNLIIGEITGILSVGFTLLSVITLFLFHKGWLS